MSPMHFMKRIWRSLRRRIEDGSNGAYEYLMTAITVRHVSGPKRLAVGADDVVLVCLVKNGAVFMESFLHHHAQLGVAHFVFLDNGSTDDTVKIASSRGNVTILRSSIPAKRFENTMRRFVIRKFAMGAWCLCVDSDEHFDYPHSDRLPLKGLIAYLNHEGYTCVIAQMLDMFDDEVIGHATDVDDLNIPERHVFYDISNIDKYDYHACSIGGMDYFVRDNTVASPQIKWQFGGVRHTQFKAYVCLTKHPLMHVSRSMTPSVHPHVSTGVRCADISLLLRHYKFAGDFRGRVQSEVRNKTWNSGESEKYWQELIQPGAVRLKQDTAQRFSGTARLVEDGFLVTSPAFDAWVDRHGTPNSQPIADVAAG